MNPKQIKQMMRRMGMEMDEISEVEEVVIKTKSKDYVIKNANVTLLNVKGQVSYQITGDVEVRAKAGGKPEIPKEDIMLVAGQANVSEEVAKKALEECDGNPAEAIIKLMSK
jgi:nascent polypeptide-associated complex subunit alpha